MTNTYEFPGKEDVRITVGDEKQQDFFPRMKIKRWDNEVNFSVGVISTFQGSHNVVGDKVEWNDGHGVGARFYEKPEDQFEFEILLDEKPASGFVLLSIETKGLRFLYQPPLTEEESTIDPDTGRPRHVRPDNVVGSYAVYHQTMKGNYTGGKNYRAGKFCHIYRPFVTDANGKQEWCDLEIIGAVMKIMIPDGLVYPVVIDPTFGTNPASPGGSWYECCAGAPMGTLYTSPANISTAQSVSTYLKEVYGDASFNMKGLIVLHSNLNIITNGIGNPVNIPTGDSGHWFTSVFGTDPSPAASTEYILMQINNGDDWDYGVASMAYDAGDANQGHEDWANSYASPANLVAVNHYNYEFSIYCTYTAAGVGVAPTSAIYGPLIGPLGGPI